jgi:hypothetical protein
VVKDEKDFDDRHGFVDHFDGGWTSFSLAWTSSGPFPFWSILGSTGFLCFPSTGLSPLLLSTGLLLSG